MARETGSDRDALAGAWANELARADYLMLERAELADRLRDFVDVLYTALDAEPFDPEPVERLGSGLVALRITAPEALAGTVRLVCTRLSERHGDRTDRIAAILAALTTGFGAAVQQWIFSEQEALRRSALDARDCAQTALLASESRFRAMFVDAAIGITISDANGRVMEVNPAMAAMLGYEVSELRGVTLPSMIHEDDPPHMSRYYNEVVAGKRDHYRLERRLRRRDGTALATSLRVSLVRDERGAPQYLIGMAEDITERLEFAAQLRHQASHDPLTGLGNRLLFTEHLQAAFVRSPDDKADQGDEGPDRVGLCYLDLDGFKAVNDSLGHVVGDQLLVSIADRLDKLAPGPGHTVARMGGDEFVVLVERCGGTEDLVRLAEQILREVAEPVPVGGYRLVVSASVGIVDRAIDSTSPEEIIRDADVTLRWAKADGKNRWASFDPERNAREVARTTLSAALPAALERNQFYVDYQPIVRLGDERLRGVEALVRWNHPEFGRIAPDRFIGLAEETGLIVQLGRWVLETACAQATAWGMAADFTDLIVSVNLAARQVAEPGLVDEVHQILDGCGLAPKNLQLELTESAIMTSPGEPLGALRKLADLGVRIAIDDFGTGYSNLAYLRQLPVHALKIAGSFVEGLRTDDGSGTDAKAAKDVTSSKDSRGSGDSRDSVDSQIVTALVSLARPLGLEVIAEGVETRQQADQLCRIGCDSAQGWLFAKPGTPDEVWPWLA